MKKVIVFGASPTSKEEYAQIMKSYEIVAFCDNDKLKIGKTLFGLEIIAPADLKSKVWDKIQIVSQSFLKIKEQLIELGIEEEKISAEFVEYRSFARGKFLEKYAELVTTYYNFSEDVAVAELGVFQGDFAKLINQAFPDRQLYLFDTFEGFDERDVLIENQRKFSKAEVGHLNITNEEIVINKLTYKDKVKVYKGYFPETTIGIEGKFCFVSLDVDLYKPTLEGLKWFFPRLEKGGIILIHDYFTEYKGVRQAVTEYLFDKKVKILPAGDSVSLVIQK